MKRTIAIFLGLAIAAPATAQTAAPTAATPASSAGVTTGATVYDASGGVVGTIESTDGTNAVVNTGSVKAAIAISSFGTGAKGPTLGLTKAQLEAQAGAQAAQAGAAFKAKLVPGATVYGAGGAQIGTIKAATADSVTITTPQGDAALPVGGFGPGPNGVTIGLSAAQLAAQMGAAAPAAAATTTTGAAATTDAAATPTDASTSTGAAATTTAKPAKKGKSGK